MSSIAVSCVFRREARHVGGIAEAPDLALLADLQTRRAVGMLADDVAAEIGEGLDSGGFLGRVEPRVDHDELGCGLRVHGLRREGEGVHAQHDLGNLIGA